MKTAKGSLWWILTPLIIAFIFFLIGLILSNVNIRFILFFISVIFFLLTGVLLIFFRDPKRVIGKGVVAVADGKIREIKKIKDKDIGECIRISTFMNIYNVHVNRMPIDGIIEKIKHISGIHLPAFKKESIKNERVIIIAKTDIGKIKIVQIAGTVARRILPYIKIKEKINKGKRIGIIRLGSRVDIYLPSHKIRKLCIEVGDIVKAGVDTIAEVND